MLTLGLCNHFTNAANITQINRYASVENKPLAAQANPLLTVQRLHFPQKIITIGDAIAYWMQHSGFKLANESQLPTALKILMTAPLPQVDRTLGPLTIQDGLTVLVGQEVFTLTKNPLTRTVNFKLKPNFLPRKGHSCDSSRHWSYASHHRSNN